MASGTWTSVATSGVWSLATNWSGSTIADGSGFTASFTSNITATTTIDTTISGGWSGTIGNIVFSDAGASGSAWTLGSQSTITLAGGTPTITATTAATINGILAGSATIIKAGAQTLTLAGANTFTGAVTVSAGTLTALTSATALGAAASTTDITVASGAALSLLSIARTYSSRTTKISGAGVGGTAAALFVNTGAVTSTLAVELQAAATIGLQSGSTLAGTISTTPASTDYALTAYAVSASTGTISGVISGGGALNAGISTAIGTLTLSGTNTFSGSIAVNAGTLSVTTSASALGADTARALTVGSGNALSLGVATTRSSFSTSIAGTGVSTNGAIIIANTGTNNLGTITLAAASSIRASSSGTLAGTITNAGLALTLQAPSGTTGTFSAAIGGTGGLVVGGTANAISQTGTVTLSSLTNSYSGDTTVSTGTLTVSGLLGSGSYAGNISIASGATFSFTSTSNQTLSGAISGLGTLTKVTGTSSILTLSGTNSYSALNIQAGTVSVASIANNVGSGVSAINVGLTGTTGTLRYTGSGETTSKVVNLAGNTTGGAIIENNGSGALVFTSNITGVSASGTRTLTLQGSNAGVNDFQGIIADVGGGAGLTAFTKAGSGYWKLSGVNTYTGVNAAIGVSVTGGKLEIPALTALGSGTKTISITATNRNGSMLLSGASVTYPSTLSWSLNSLGVDQTNNPLGAIRALATSTIAGTVAVGAISTVYADTGDVTFNGLVTGATSFGLQAATGRTITIAGGLGTAGMTLYSIGPGAVVWNGVDANALTTAPIITGGTLRQVVTRSTAVTPLQFAHTSVALGQSPSQTSISSRYQYTGGTLEISNSGAAGAVDYTGLSSTSAINLSRGSGKLKLSRDAAQTFTVRLGNTSGPTSGVITLEYAGTTGTIGTDSSIIVSGTTANSTLTRFIISNGSALVPVYFDTNKVAVPAVFDGSQTNVQPTISVSTATLPSPTLSKLYNLAADITSQVTAQTNTIRFDTGTTTPITLAAGAILQSPFIMDMGTGTTRTIVAGATGAKLTRNIGANSVFSVYTNNVTGTGATISADMDARYNASFTKAGVGILTLSGAVANLSGINIAEGTFRIGSAGTFDNTFGAITLGNVYAASGTTVAAEFNQTGDVVVAGLSGGGANTAVTLSGGDLVLRANTTTTFGGDIVLGGSQKLKVNSLSQTPESSLQSFQGAFPFTAIEMSRGYISLDPQYGATVTGTPSVTATGGSYIAIQAQNPLEADYTVNFGALTVSAGSLRVTLANSTSIGNPYNTRITAASLTVTGDSVVNLLSQGANAQQSFTISSVTTAGTLGNGVNVYNGGNIAYYRLAGQTLANSTVALVNTVDSPAYGTDANFSAIKTTGASFTSTGVNDNVSIATTAITAQNSVTVKSLRSAVNITMASSANRLTADLVVLAGTITLASGELATQTGSLYVNASSTSVISSKITNNGATLTKVILYTPSPLTLSGANDYSGGTVVNGGSNSITLSGASPLGTGVIVGNGGGGFTVASGTLTLGATNTITLNDGGLRLDASTGAAYVLNGAISGTGDLYLTGAGTFTLGAVGTGIGALRLNSSSTVTVNAAQAFSEYDFNNASLTFQYSSGFTTDISALITKRPGNTYRIDTNGQDITWASSVGNGSTYVKVGDGTHTLSAENYFASATVSTGTVSAGNVAALGYGNVTLSAGTVLQTLTTGGQNGKLTITGTLTNSAGGTIRIGG